MEKLNPKALAECGDYDLDSREGVQEVEEGMILSYVLNQSELPMESAKPFARWLIREWFDWNEDGENTNGDIIEGALMYWRGDSE